MIVCAGVAKKHVYIIAVRVQPEKLKESADGV